jgi:peroxiredoxin
MKKIIVVLLLGIFSVAVAEDVIDQSRKLARDGKVEEALTLLRNEEKKKPDDMDLHDQIQKILIRHGRRSEALVEYKQRYDQQPTGFNGYLYFHLLEKPSEQETGFRSVIAKDPASVWGYYGLANSLLDQDDLEKAVTEGKKGLDKVKEPARLHYVLARVYRRMKDYPNAAEQMREYYKLDPGDDNRETLKAYEWFEVSHAEDGPEKFALAKKYVEKYKDLLLKAESLEEISNLAETGFVYADNNSDAPPFNEIVAYGLKAIRKLPVPTDREEKEMLLRVKGALLGLKAWAQAKSNHFADAKQTLLAARNTAGSEMYYFSALARRLMADKQGALRAALAAASYPPVYKSAKNLTAELWKETNASEDGLEAALHAQRQKFAPQRKARVLGQMVSEKVPEFQIKTADNKTLTEKDVSGKIILMNFWAVWCPPCREELPHWNAFYAAHKDDPDLMFVAVGEEPWETMQNYMKNQNFSFPVYQDEKFWEQFSVDGIPTMLMIDPSGKIRFRNTGFEEGMEYDETLLWQIDAVRNHHDTKTQRTAQSKTN